MRNYLKLIIFTLIFFSSCASWKSGLKINGDYNIAINNAILDFINRSSLVKHDSTFSVDFKDIDTEIIGISLLGTVGKIIITADGKTSVLPTRYLEYNGKLFYWYDENYSLNNDIIRKLDEYNLIDSVETIADAEFIIDDAKKGMDYYFCKKNLHKYKKIKTNKALGYYEPSKLECGK